MSSRDPFRVVLLCEDIRQEIGRKNSLMGVFSGDIIVADMPANIPIALYVQYEAPEPSQADKVEFKYYIDDRNAGSSAVNITPQPTGHPLTLLLPSGIVTFPHDCIFRIIATINDGEPVEILSKKIFKGEVQPRM